jgi:predicted ATPase/DNA-binding SARP family transcriptional activator
MTDSAMSRPGSADMPSRVSEQGFITLRVVESQSPTVARLKVLGGLEILDWAGTPVPLRGRLIRSLFALLLIASPDPIPAERMVEELWVGNTPANARRTLHVHVSRLRKQLAGPLADALEIKTSEVGYVLCRTGCSIDSLEFERSLMDAESTLRSSPRAAAACFASALALWRGAALAEFGSVQTLAREADRLEDLRGRATEGLAQALLACGEAAESMRVIAPLVAAEPLRERPRLLLMRALHRADRQVEALEQYQSAAAALDEIGLQPGRALRELQAAILRDERWLTEPPHDRDWDQSRDRAAPRTHGAHSREATGGADHLALGERGNVPVPMHPLVGRQLELLAMRELLVDRRVGLVTVHGPGGVGKTRLATEIASQLAGQYAHGAWFVSLAALSDAGLVGFEIARTLGVPMTPSTPPEQTLRAWLNTREVLLVLDNFEQVLGASPVVSELLAASAGLQVVVTSREPLKAEGEELLEAGCLCASDAAELFLERARALRPNAGAGPEESAAVASVCVQLDGLALALELVAARAALFSLPALASRLGDRLDVTEVTRDVPERQRTLRRAIDWSYELLSSSEQHVFCALAAFPGGARIEAVAAVLGEPISAVTDILSGLVAKSLLRSGEDPDGEPRVWMLSTIREYAGELLAMDAARQSIVFRHAEHYAKLARDAAPRMYEADQASWLERLGADHENLRSALDHLSSERPPDALRLAVTLAAFWDGRGYYAESRARLGGLIDALPETDLDAARARFWLSRLAFQWRSGEDAATMLDAAIPTLEAGGDVRNRILAGMRRSVIALSDGPESMLAVAKANVNAAEGAGDPWALSLAYSNAFQAHDVCGHSDLAHRYAISALAQARITGNPLALANATGMLAQSLMARNELDSVETLLEEGIAYADEIRYESISSVMRLVAALAALLREQLEPAARWVREALHHATVDNNGHASTLVIAGASLASLRADGELAAMLWAHHHRDNHNGTVPDDSVTTRLKEALTDRGRQSVSAKVWETAWNRGLEQDFPDVFRLMQDAYA